MNIEMQIHKPWIVRIPEVYRYMNQEYIDRFFETGEQLPNEKGQGCTEQSPYIFV